MNLIFDIGNSSSKMAIFDGHEKITSFRTREFSCDKMEKILSPYKIDKAIISSVREIPDYIFDLLTVNIPRVEVLSNKSRLPFSIEYSTPETLGPDRIAAAAGAYSLYPGSNILIIDAGSALTYDFVSGKSYKGGNISPGLQMRFKALHKFTGKLPLVTPVDIFPQYGTNTTEAITAGVINGVIYEINEYIRTFQKNYAGIKVVLTGGDSGYLKERISYKTTCVPDIVIDGLNFILEYDAK